MVYDEWRRRELNKWALWSLVLAGVAIVVGLLLTR